jgi:hypothetical protein
VKPSSIVLAVLGLLSFGGCAHPINITPSMTSLDVAGQSAKIPKKIGYYVSPEDRTLEVTTPAGGGDSIKYRPYAELESGLYKVLANTFADVYFVKSLDDKSFLSEQKISYVLIPKIQTNSSSDSLLTWPPTNFNISIECRAITPGGEEVWKTTATGEGQATFKEFVSEYSLAGRRASERVLLDLQKKLASSPLK